MSKTRVLIAIASGILLMLVIMFITSLPSPEGPGTKDSVTQSQPEISQAGNYELAPDIGSGATPAVESVPEYTVAAEPAQNKPAKKAKPADVEPADNGYDSVDPGIIDKRPDMPPADEIMQMQKRGIVAY